MIYEVKKTMTSTNEEEAGKEIKFEIDDTILFAEQPDKFKKLFNDTKVVDLAKFDNCDILLLHTDRLVITPKTEEDEYI